LENTLSGHLKINYPYIISLSIKCLPFIDTMFGKTIFLRRRRKRVSEKGENF
jgi:hypothetical protein